MGDDRTPGPLTDVSEHAERLAGLPEDPVELCRVAQGLVIEPHDALALGVPEARAAEKDLRPASSMLDAVVAQGATTLSEPCPPEQRVLGTCRHVATMACALLRFRGHPARARCGFAGYFVPDSRVDHWIVEYDVDGRWVRTASDGETGAEYDELMDVLAATCAEDRADAIRELGAHPDLAVPADLIV